MKLSTRIKIACAIVFVLPVLMIVIAIVGLTRFNLDVIEKKYDMNQTSYEMIINPMNMIGHMTVSIIEEIETVIDMNPERMEDEVYLKDLNDRLQLHSSCLFVRKEDEVIFNGFDDDIVFGKTKDQILDTNKNESIYIIDEHPYHIQELSYAYSDGKMGQVFIYTNMDQLAPQYKNTFVQAIFFSVGILFVVTVMVMFWLYKSVVRPLHKLKLATENIKEGNLNFSVTAESDDEIGELCVAFEEMRIKLKSQIERNIQYEKESKELISNISHDLKTPMTAIKGYIEGLMDGVADTKEKQDKYIRTIYNKVNDMHSLIEELFLYAKLDSNAVTYSFAKVNLDGYFQDCVEELSLDLEAQGVELGYFNYADRSTIVIADPEQLKRVINNIVGNSVKYASDRELKISIRIMEESEFVKIEIEDNGKGIAKKELPLIFDRCYRTDASRTSSQGGSGLGLSIAKKIIEEHGGKIWAESTENVGTTMCFVLRKYKESMIYE